MATIPPNGYDITTNRLYRDMQDLNRDYEDLGAGKYRSMLVQGPPGIGKTYSAEHHLQKGGCEMILARPSAHNMVDVLFENQGSNQVTVFDDFDACWNSEPSMNQLKIACDPKSSKRIVTDNRSKGYAQFEYRGRIAFISNRRLLSNPDFSGIDKALHPHVAALISRFQLAADITFDPLDCFHYTSWLACEGAHMLRDYRHDSVHRGKKGLSLKASNDVLAWFGRNFAQLVEISPRMIMLVAHHRLVSPDIWDRRAMGPKMIRKTTRVDASGKKLMPQTPWTITVG